MAAVSVKPSATGSYYSYAFVTFKNKIQHCQFKQYILFATVNRDSNTDILEVNSNITALDSRTALHVTAKEGQYDRVNFLISHGANLEAKDLSGFTPLHLAALYRHVDVINLLLDRGAMVDGINSLNKTALFFAIRNNCLSCVEVLLKRGANVNHRDSQYTTPLDFANLNKYQDIIRVIQSYMEKNVTRLL